MKKKSKNTTLEGALKSNRVLTLDEIRVVLGGVSMVTAQRKLRKIDYRSSYNCNGRFYTRYDSRLCDRQGLWSHGEARFSRDGSLTATVRRLIYESKAGHSQRELQEILGVRVQNVLATLLDRNEIVREKIGGVFLNLHRDKKVSKVQIEQRRLLLSTVFNVQIPLETVIQVLLVLVRHPGDGEAEVARRLTRRSPPIRLDTVRCVFQQYQLGRKRGRRNS